MKTEVVVASVVLVLVVIALLLLSIFLVKRSKKAPAPQDEEEPPPPLPIYEAKITQEIPGKIPVALDFIADNEYIAKEDFSTNDGDVFFSFASIVTTEKKEGRLFTTYFILYFPKPYRYTVKYLSNLDGLFATVTVPITNITEDLVSIPKDEVFQRTIVDSEKEVALVIIPVLNDFRYSGPITLKQEIEVIGEVLE